MHVIFKKYIFWLYIYYNQDSGVRLALFYYIRQIWWRIVRDSSFEKCLWNSIICWRFVICLRNNWFCNFFYNHLGHSKNILPLCNFLFVRNFTKKSGNDSSWHGFFCWELLMKVLTDLWMPLRLLQCFLFF